MTRAWCLFEVLHALQAGVELIIRLPAAEEQSFLAALADDYDAVTSMLVRVQAERAQASNPEDLANIVQAVKATVGFQGLNAMVKTALREWCLQQAMRGVRKMDAARSAEETFPKLRYQVATVLNEFGQHKQALEYYAKASKPLGCFVVEDVAMAGNAHITA
jgi:hypothetical protein